jgi:hypothetical protein
MAIALSDCTFVRIKQIICKEIVFKRECFILLIYFKFHIIMKKKIMSLVVCLTILCGVFCLNNPLQQEAKIGSYLGGVIGGFAGDYLELNRDGAVSAGSTIGMTLGVAYGTQVGAWIGGTIGSVAGPGGTLVGYVAGGTFGRYVCPL